MTDTDVKQRDKIKNKIKEPSKYKVILHNDDLYNAINKWEATAPIEILLNTQKLKEHMIKENGICISFNLWSKQDIQVVDEKKYMMFLLKYGS